MAEKYWDNIQLKNGNKVHFVPPSPNGDRLGGITETQKNNINKIPQLETNIISIENNLNIAITGYAITFSDISLKQYIKNNDDTGTVIDLENPQIASSGYYKWAAVECNPGDIFLINALAGSAARAWSFLDIDKKILSKSDANIDIKNLILTAPQNAAWIVINDRDDRISYYGQMITNKLQNIQSQKVDKDVLFNSGTQFIILKSSDDKHFKLTVNSDGSLTTNEITE